MNQKNNKPCLVGRGVGAEQYLGGYDNDLQIFKRDTNLGKNNGKHNF